MVTAGWFVAGRYRDRNDQGTALGLIHYPEW